jgi:threonine dehydrogenase-like Zn-dependent dehydrogenase
MLSLVGAGLVELDPLVTHQFAAADFQTAFELMDRREGIVGKVVLEHEPR